MFTSNPGRDPHSRSITRRVFLITGGATGIAALVALRRSPAVHASGAIHGTPGTVTIVNFSDDGKNVGRQTVSKLLKADAAWQQQLGNNSFGIARQADTEMPFSGVTWNEHHHGLFRCLCCDTALFRSETKFESGTGWPSFWAPIAKENVAEKTDTTLGIARTEIQCARCEAHLGHVFNDGPAPTGLRYCMNSASLRFIQA